MWQYTNCLDFILTALHFQNLYKLSQSLKASSTEHENRKWGTRLQECFLPILYGRGYLYIKYWHIFILLTYIYSCAKFWNSTQPMGMYRQLRLLNYFCVFVIRYNNLKTNSKIRIYDNSCWIYVCEGRVSKSWRETYTERNKSWKSMCGRTGLTR